MKNKTSDHLKSAKQTINWLFICCFPGHRFQAHTVDETGINSMVIDAKKKEEIIQ